MKIITEEISKIEMKNINNQTFEQQLKDLLEDNVHFIKNSIKFEPLIEKIKTELNENEEKTFQKYKINREYLTNIKIPNMESKK